MSRRSYLQTFACVLAFATLPAARATGKSSAVMGFLRDYLVGKAVDGMWDSATGKADAAELEARIKRLEQFLGSDGKPVAQLRRGVTQRTTRPEYDARADATLRVLESSAIRDSAAFSHIYIGSVGRLRAALSLTWRPDGSVTGSYLYPTRDANQIYDLKGSNPSEGTLTLQEYTAGTVTANISLRKEVSPAWIIWKGRMFNTDGRTFDIAFQRER